ncbi:MAG: 1-(5-phosphoribosyl)-5-[(5-phosphoribosylamino)methylideneamino]imidazole-4-carboxamide isomerase [Endomicrobiales bacterium]|nr:1-(5-phosphoribosyl)-5-[(5-phosphoribosylamino)methylideneamino]imidazole-4-carboxamide isomerase [Endomicrobiales bacterium]
MLILPAIDMRGGNCVMLKQGKLEQETVYSKDPVFIAKLWQAKGAKRLHVVDLDAAFQSMSNNFELIKKICSSVDVPVQAGGGVRNFKVIENLFDAGAKYVIVGTLAVYNPEVLRQAVDKYGEKMIVAIDARDGKAAIGGWKDTTSVDVFELIGKVKQMGVKEIIHTDIKKDGMLEGPNYDSIKEICARASLRMIASGGISKIEDIKKLKDLEKSGLYGAVIGKALYTEDIKLEEAIKIAEQ